jgi:hypothetical protein
VFTQWEVVYQCCTWVASLSGCEIRIGSNLDVRIIVRFDLDAKANAQHNSRSESDTLGSTQGSKESSFAGDEKATYRLNASS